MSSLPSPDPSQVRLECCRTYWVTSGDPPPELEEEWVFWVPPVLPLTAS